MRQQLEPKGDGVVDEIGVLALHSGYADHFFPGTSILHRRPRYLLFTCWNYLTLAEKEEITPRNARRGKEALEKWMADQFVKADLTGFIGERIYPKMPAQTVDATYWNALRTFGLYRGPDRGTLLANWQSNQVVRAEAKPENDLEEEAVATFLVPKPPPYWGRPRPREPLTFDLSRSEATFLLQRLQSLDPCLLSESATIALRARPHEKVPWREPLLLEAANRLGERARLQRTEQVSAMALVVRAIYAALVEKLHERTLPVSLRKELEQPEFFRNLLRELADDEDGFEQARALSLDEVRSDVPDLRASFVALLEHVHLRLSQVKRARDIDAALLDSETHELFERVERERKGPNRARLPNTQAGFERRRGFGPETLRIYGLEFRWPVVKLMLEDLHEGLNR